MTDLPIEQLLHSILAASQPHLDLERVKRYSELLDKLPPVTVFRLEDQTLLLVDGYHRMAAARAAGRMTVRADVQEGTKTEAIQFAAERAARERGFSNQQAREAIRRYSGGQWSKQDR